MKNNQYTQEFRDETVQLVLKSEQSTMQIAKDLGLNEKTVYNWVRVYKQKNNIPINRNNVKQNTSLDINAMEELKQLRAENKLLKQEREILKKAATYFAKETL